MQACIISSKVETQTESHKPAAAQKVKLIWCVLLSVICMQGFLCYAAATESFQIRRIIFSLHICDKAPQSGP